MTREAVRTAPARIWLQVGDSDHLLDEPFPDGAEGVTWCSVPGNVDAEVEYVRADLAPRRRRARPTAADVPPAMLRGPLALACSSDDFRAGYNACRGYVLGRIAARQLAAATGKFSSPDPESADYDPRLYYADPDAQERTTELAAALGWPGGISVPVPRWAELLREVARLRAGAPKPPGEPR